MNVVVNVTAPKPWVLLAAIVVLTCAAFFSAADAFGDSRSKARRIHDRIAGVPPSDAVLDDLVLTINAAPGIQGEIDAAFEAMDNAGFYNVTLKNFVAPWTNRDGDVFVPLNDYTATVSGDGAREQRLSRNTLRRHSFCRLQRHLHKQFKRPLSGAGRRQRRSQR